MNAPSIKKILIAAAPTPVITNISSARATPHTASKIWHTIHIQDIGLQPCIVDTNLKIPISRYLPLTDPNLLSCKI